VPSAPASRAAMADVMAGRTVPTPVRRGGCGVGLQRGDHQTQDDQEQ